MFAWTLKMKPQCSFSMPGTSHSVTKCHIPEDPNVLQHCCELLSLHVFFLSECDL
jgi:hypothetical protein